MTAAKGAKSAQRTPPSGKVWIGISGWRYDGWRGTFYPEGWPKKRELEYASRAVQTIEINGTHYSLQSPASFRQWYAATPETFVFSVKGARYLTHVLRFRDETATIACANFFAQGLLALNDKLGPLLWQFPPTYPFDAARFERFLAVLPPDSEAALRLAKRHDGRVTVPWLEIDRCRPMRHAIEIRHSSFLVPAFVELLRRYGVALVVSDSTEPWPCIEDATADFAYVRLHGSTAKYAGAYGDDALDNWASRFKAWRAGRQAAHARLVAPERALHEPRDVYCYFDNDQKTEAPFDAQRLISRLGATR
ncbi:DUF72 domain-containing protein [Paraburkholderia lycopersici]|uniref:Uncharacterized conserved protein YecE, DUF72 family n=1 Tax=Paraburkholderia lycopersici TaxID=416944 RepID=A0A1G6YLM3_9BURK|nr:DUF72 domain-containing protein [Paraburkholderia lycopersici]SDD90446.1 Uncharacterized conserved protein YecE, DUF72 family [Paraburkholderia lycopersici]